MKFEHRDFGKHVGALPLTTLIDVVFLLLIFFLVTMRFASPEGRLGSGLQVERQSAAQGTALERQVVWIVPGEGAEGAVFRVGTSELGSAAALEARLRLLERDRGVFVRPHPDVPVGAIAAAWQACADAGFTDRWYVPMKAGGGG